MLIKAYSQNYTDNVGTNVSVLFMNDGCKNGFIESTPINYFATDISVPGSTLVSNIQWRKSDTRCPKIRYSFFDVDMSKKMMDWSVFTFDNVTGDLTVQTSSPAKARLYRITVLATMAIYNAQVDFQMTITNICPTAKVYI